jgi:hypothetical protein
LKTNAFHSKNGVKLANFCNNFASLKSDLNARMLFNNRFESSVEISSQNGLSRKLTRLFDWVLIILSLIGFSFIILYGAIAQGKAPDSKQLHQHLSKEEINRLTVDPVSQVTQKNIENHIIALAGQRYTKKEKTKTIDYISKTLESFGYVVQITEGESKNLIADLKGSITPQQIFIIAAHYDTVKPVDSRPQR